MDAIIIAIGDELINGAGIDTNSSYLSHRLLEKGIIPRRHITVGDNIDEIAKV
ncbi:MAG: damage-inducible protein CinA, partial [Planctomycetes bacterium]|nr:damage-inducible protein CinA [Planctomycetota bacterium]